MPFEFKFNDAAFRELVNNPGGGVRGELKRVSDEVVSDVKEWIGNPQVPGQRNPGPAPWSDSGDLRRSVRANFATDLQTRLIEYDITAGAVHGGIQYVTVLMDSSLAKNPASRSTDYDLVPPRIRELTN